MLSTCSVCQTLRCRLSQWYIESSRSKVWERGPKVASGGGAFSVEEVAYLKTLPAVADATRSRIIYTEEFKVDCVLRYAQGESPVQLFREAGLDPSLIGYKRIECAIARWRRQMNVAATTVKQPRGKRGNAVMADLRAPTHIDASFAPQAIGSRGDIRDVLIAQQVRRIDELERQVDELSRELRKLSAPHGDAGSDPMGASGETRA